MILNETFTSSYSNGDSCVAVRFDVNSDNAITCVKVCHSKDPDQGELTFTPGEWQAFLDGMAAREFQLPPGVPVAG